MHSRLLFLLVFLLFAVTITQSVVAAGKVSGLRGEISDLNGEVGSGTTTVSGLRSELSTAEAEVTDLRTKLIDAEAEVSDLRDTLASYESEVEISAATLAGAVMESSTTATLSKTVCEGYGDDDDCYETVDVTVKDCDGDICMEHDWGSGTLGADGTASGDLEDYPSTCEGVSDGDDFTWKFSFEPTRATFNRTDDEWYVSEFDATLTFEKPQTDCNPVTEKWEVTGEVT